MKFQEFPKPNNWATSIRSGEAIVSGGRRPAPCAPSPRGGFVLRGWDLCIDRPCCVCSAPSRRPLRSCPWDESLGYRALGILHSRFCVLLVNNLSGSVLLLGRSESFHVQKESRGCRHARSVHVFVAHASTFLVPRKGISGAQIWHMLRLSGGH